MFHGLRGGVQVNKTFVDLEFVTVPGFGTLTARLDLRVEFREYFWGGRIRTDLRVVIFKTFVGSLTGPLTRRFLSFALLMRSVETTERNEHRYFSGTKNKKQTFFEILDISRGQGDPDFVNLGRWKGSTGGIVFLISLSDVTHGDRVRR